MPPSPRPWSTASRRRRRRPTSTTVEQRFGYRDDAVVVGEPFRQWVIEDSFAGRAAALGPGRRQLRRRRHPVRAPQDAGAQRRPVDASPPRRARRPRAHLRRHGRPAARRPSCAACWSRRRCRRCRRCPASSRRPMSSRASPACATPRSATATTRSPPTARRRSCSACSTRSATGCAQRRERRRSSPSPVAGWMAYLVQASDRFGKRWPVDGPLCRPRRRDRRRDRRRRAGAGRRHPRHRHDLRPARSPRAAGFRGAIAAALDGLLSAPRPMDRSIATGAGLGRSARERMTEGRHMKLGFLTAPFRGDAARRGRRLGELGRLRGAGDRLLAEILRPDAAAMPAPATSTSPAISAVAGQGDRRRAGREGPRRSPALGYYPNPLHPDPPIATTVIDHLKKVIVAAAPHGRARGQHLLRRRRRQDRRRQLAGRARRSGPTSSPMRATTASSSPSRTAR